MLNKKLQITTLIVLLALAAVLSACVSTSSLRIGWVCFDGPQKMDCSYREFSGREVSQERFDAGDQVTVNYDITVESGSLTFTIENPEAEVVFTANLSDSLEDVHTFTAEQNGRYSFVVVGEKTEGAFLIEWENTG